MTGLKTRDKLRERLGRILGAAWACACLTSCAKLPVGPDSLTRRAAGAPSSISIVSGVPATDAIARLERITDADSLARSVGSQVLGTVPELDLVLLRTPAGSSTETFVQRLEQDPRVLAAEPDARIEPAESGQSSMAFSEADRTWTDVEDQDALLRIGAVEAQQRARGAGVRVAILDTGVDLDHPALAASLDLPGIEPGVTTGAADDRPQGVDTNGDGVVDGSLGHGTHVAGIVHAVAPDARLLPVRVLDSDGIGDVFGVVRGLVLATNAGVAVANLSLGLPSASAALQAALDRARAAGVVVVAAAGNRDQTALDFPAAYGPVLAVAGTDPDDRKASFSDYGASVDVSAPAVGILSTYWDGTYARWSGTSMASPFVSGTAALLCGRLGERSAANASAVEALIRSGATPLAAIDPVYGDLLGAGRVSAAGSLRQLPDPALSGETAVTRRTRH